MEIRLNLVLLAVLGSIWLGLESKEPVAVLPDTADAGALAELEDAFAHDRSDRALARRLSTRYLEVDRPGLAIAVLRSAEPELLEDPMLLHRLAQAYERTGRILDARATAALALARCARSLGTAGSASVTPVPAFECREAEYAAIDVHDRALDHMVRWGVADPTVDPRSGTAYELAFRTARIASASR